MSEHNQNWIMNLDKSAIWTVVGICVLFSGAIGVTLWLPRFIERDWLEPVSSYQVQMYEKIDPQVYISGSSSGEGKLYVVYHLKEGHTLACFKETESTRIIAPDDLNKYISRLGDEELKLSSELLMLRRPKKTEEFDAVASADILQQALQAKWEAENSGWQSKGLQRPNYDIKELYRPEGSEAFALAKTDGVIESWIDSDYAILDSSVRQDWHQDEGVVYFDNPEEYRVTYFTYGKTEGFRYDPNGKKLSGLDELKSDRLGFISRQELIKLGEDVYRAEGCSYCHTDQTRTLVQDTVLNGSESYPAPPSVPNEYIYQQVTFMGTRRIGPDLSRVGIKRSSRNWHKSHFWSPKTASAGTIMPAFRHFFDDDPRGTARSPVGVPNYKFEAIYQYLMTKGTRMYPPTKAWWVGKDPIRTIDIIEGRSQINPKEEA